jgi:protein TFG
MASSNSTASFTAVNDEFSHLDLSGKLIIKVQLGDDIRRIPIHNEEITYDELLLMMQRVFRGKLESTDEVLIKYRDDDNDLITIFDSSDLSFAIQCSRILKITLFVNGQPMPLVSDEVKLIRKELQQIRNRCNYLLDRLEPPTKAATDENNVEDVDRNQAVKVVQPTKEFDPLTLKRGSEIDLQNGPQNEDKRSVSPDSVSSLSSQTRQQQSFNNISAPELKPMNAPSPQSFLSHNPNIPQLQQQVMGQQSPQQPRFAIQPQPYPGQFPPSGPPNPNVHNSPNPFPSGPQPSQVSAPTSTSNPSQLMGGFPHSLSSGPAPQQPQSVSNYSSPQPQANPQFGAPPPPMGQMRPPYGGGPPPLSGPTGPSQPPSGPQPPFGPFPHGPQQSGPPGPPTSGSNQGFGQPGNLQAFAQQQQMHLQQQQQQQQQQQPQQQSMPSGPYPVGIGPPPPQMSGPPGTNPYSRGIGPNRPRYPPNPGFPQPSQ